MKPVQATFFKTVFLNGKQSSSTREFMDSVLSSYCNVSMQHRKDSEMSKIHWSAFVAHVSLQRTSHSQQIHWYFWCALYVTPFISSSSSICIIMKCFKAAVVLNLGSASVGQLILTGINNSNGRRWRLYRRLNIFTETEDCPNPTSLLYNYIFKSLWKLTVQTLIFRLE